MFEGNENYTKTQLHLNFQLTALHIYDNKEQVASIHPYLRIKRNKPESLIYLSSFGLFLFYLSGWNGSPLERRKSRSLWVQITICMLIVDSIAESLASGDVSQKCTLNKDPFSIILPNGETLSMILSPIPASVSEYTMYKS